MGYSILDAGRTQKNQAIQSFDALARQEQQSEYTNDQIKQAEKQQDAQTKGQFGGMAASYGIDKWLTSSAPTSAISPTAEASLSTSAGAEIAAAPSAEAISAAPTAGAIGTTEAAGASSALVAGETAGTAAASTTAATAAGTTAATTAAATTATAGGVAGAGAATAAPMAAMGPVGWVALAGLLAYSLFS